jgi:ribonucleoside-triphosphate reductase
MEAKEAAEKNGTNIVDEFMSILDTAIDDCIEGLIDRYNYICSQPKDSAKFMYENGLMAGYVPEEGIRSALKHGTLAVGMLGLAECLNILIGKNQTTKEGMELARKIESLYKRKCAEAKSILRRDPDGYEYYLNFGVYNTPAETLAFTAMTKFKKKYGEIPGISDKKFFTNSIHVPVWEEISPFEKIDIESELGNYSNAGCILYIELDSTVLNNLDAIETYVNYAMDHDVPYFAINIPNDTCLECGYTGEFNNKCPVCGSTHIQQLRRVTGYLSGDYKTSFNEGKQQEVELRYQHTKKLIDPLHKNIN